MVKLDLRGVKHPEEINRNLVPLHPFDHETEQWRAHDRKLVPWCVHVCSVWVCVGVCVCVRVRVRVCE